MPKKDFTQIALDVVQRATGEVPRPEPKQEPKKKAPPKDAKGEAKKTGEKAS